MPSITVSLDYATLGQMEAYRFEYGLENMSQSARNLIKKGLAHEREIKAKLEVERGKIV